MHIKRKVTGLFALAAIALTAAPNPLYADTHTPSAAHHINFSKQNNRRLYRFLSQHTQSAQQGQTVVFVARAMFKYETWNDTVAREQKSFPGSLIIQLPQKDAQAFILSQINQFAQEGMLPLARMVIDAHGAPNFMTTAPYGISQPGESIDVHGLLEALADIQQNLKNQHDGKSHAKITNEIILESCDTLADSTLNSLLKYIQETKRLNATLLASAKVVFSPSSGAIQGDYFQFAPDGSIQPYQGYKMPASLQSAQDAASLGAASTKEIECAASLSGGACLNNFSLAGDAVIDASNQLKYFDLTEKQTEKYVDTILENAFSLSPQDGMEAYMLAAQQTYNSSKIVLAMDDWKQKVNKLSLNDRIETVSTLKYNLQKSQSANLPFIMPLVQSVWRDTLLADAIKGDTSPASAAIADAANRLTYADVSGQQREKYVDIILNNAPDLPPKESMRAYIFIAKETNISSKIAQAMRGWKHQVNKISLDDGRMKFVVSIRNDLQVYDPSNPVLIMETIQQAYVAASQAGEIKKIGRVAQLSAPSRLIRKLLF